MDFTSKHKEWCRSIPLRNRIFENFYAQFVHNHIKKLSIRNDILIFENEFQIKYWSKHYENYFKMLNDKTESTPLKSEKKLIDAYKWYAGYASIPINKLLREGDNNVSDNTKFFEIIELISSELNKFSIKNRMIASRRMKSEDLKTWLNNIKPKKGQKIQDLGFLSTSLNLFSRSNPNNTLENLVVKN